MGEGTGREGKGREVDKEVLEGGMDGGVGGKEGWIVWLQWERKEEEEMDEEL